MVIKRLSIRFGGFGGQRPVKKVDIMPVLKSVSEKETGGNGSDSDDSDIEEIIADILESDTDEPIFEVSIPFKLKYP